MDTHRSSRALLFAGVLALAPPLAAQVTLVQQEFTGLSVPFNAPDGDDYPFVVSDAGAITSMWWGFGSTGWRDLHIRYTLPSGAFFEQLAGAPWVDLSHLLGEESAGTWTLNLLETVPGPAHTLDTGIAVVTQRHADPDLPVTGDPVPELAGLDDVMRDILVEHGMEAGTLAVVKDRAVVYERGFGWQDRERTTPIAPDAIMRLATTSVIVTARAVQQLVADGQLELDDNVFDLLGIPPLAAHPVTDPRVLDVTVGQLVHHTSGLDEAPTPYQLGVLLGLGRNATLEESIAYMWSATLLFDPGAGSEFSHWGYQVLGQVIEVVSGTSYDDYIHGVVGAVSGMPTLHQARDTAAEAYPGEIWYAGQWFQHDEEDFFFTGPLVEQCYAIDFSNRPGAGAVVASARDLATYVTLYFFDGSPKPVDLTGIGSLAAVYGSLPGTTTVVYDRVEPDGSSLAFVALVNERVDGVDVNGQLHQAIAGYLDGITVWPDVDPWTDLRGGTAGPAGVPQLDLSGPLTPASTIQLDLVDGPPSALGYVFIAFSSAPAPFLGGTLHAFPIDDLVLVATDPAGELHGAAYFPGAIPGQGLWFQVGLVDAGVPLFGACLSNAVLGTIP